MINMYQHKIVTMLLLIAGSLTAFNAAAQTDTPSLTQTKTIAIAYGSVPMEKNSSAISTVNASTIQKNSVTSIEEALNGTASGLYSIKSGGQDFGARNFDFFIRGKATIASATPLILVDDVESNINLLDFNQVVSVTVLKDASALAMYGMRGANGVILIKTKRGSVSKNVIGLDFRVGVQNPVKVRQTVNAYDYTSLYNEALANDGSAGIYNPNAYLNNTNPTKYPDVNAGSLFLKNQSLTQQYNFTASGGSQIAQYFCQIGYTKLDGLFHLNNMANAKQKDYERYSFRTNLDVNLGAGFKMAVDVLAAFDYTRAPWISASYDANASASYLFNSLMTTPANAFPVTNPDGSLGGTSVYRDNPQGILLRGLRTDEHKLLTSRINLTKDLSFIAKGLKASVMYHFENYNSSYKAKYKSFAVYQLDSVTNTYSKYGTDDTKSTTTGGETSGYYRDNNFIANLNYDRTFKNHDISAVVLYNLITSNTSGDVPDHVYQGISGRVMYGYAKKYLAELTASYQGSNNFQRGKRYGFFPAAAVSWVASEEKFLQSNKIVDYLKIRASYGLNGNDQTGGNRFAYRQAWYAGSGYGFGNPNASSDGSYEGTLSNTDATWEKAYKADIGIDVKTLKGKLSFTVDVFHETRNDIMVDQANVVPSLIGISLPLINAGTIENKGLEASLTYSKKFGDIGINLGGNFLYAHNTIIDLKELPYQYSWMYRKGNSIDTRYGFVANGIYNSAADLTGEPTSAYKTVGPGDIRYVNQNPADDQVINELDKVAIGNAFPEIIYGVNLEITYKGFDFSCYGEGSSRSQIYVRPGNFTQYALNNRWTSATSNDNFPKLSISDTHNTQNSTFWQESGNFFRISTVEVGYELPKVWVSKVALSSARVYLNANNVFTFSTEREGRDPEALTAGFSEYPLLRTVILGLSLKL